MIRGYDQRIWSETIASDRLRLSVNSSAIVCDRDRRRRTMVYSCDRLRLYVNSCAIVCDRVRSRSQAIAGIEPCSIRAIGCDRLRSSAIECDHIWTKFCDYAIGMCPIILCFPSVQHCKRHDTMTTSCLSTFTLACVLTRWKVKLTRNSLWKKLENTIVCSNALAKTSKTSSRRLTPSPK